MTYRVEVAYRAVRDLEILYVEKHAADSQAAARWYNGLEERVHALETYPLRGSVVPESKKLRRKLLQLLYGKKPHIYRVIYEVDERRRMVFVLTVRHGARRRLKAADLG